MSFYVLDPTYADGGGAAEFAYAERLASLAGATVGIVSNGKQGTRPFFEALEHELRSAHGVANVVQTVKSNYSAPADREIMDRATEWNALISGIGD